MKKNILKLMKWTLGIYAILLPWISIEKIVYYNSDEKILFFSDIKGVTDCFLYGKSIFTMITAVVLLIMLFILIVGNRNDMVNICNKMDTVVLICVCIYFVCTVMSFAMSKYKKIALWGGTNSFEGTLVLISYMILFISSYCIAKLEKISDIKKYIKNYVLIECLILAVLTFIELGYKPIYNIIAGYKMVELNRMLTLTFYNSTYCAAFILLLQPFAVYFLLEDTLRWRKFIWGSSCSFLFICIILTKSTAAFYFSLMELIIIFIFYMILSKKDIKIVFIKIAVILLATVGIVVCMNIIGVNIHNYINMSVKNTTESIHKQEYFNVEYMNISENVITFVNSDGELKCVINDGKIQFKNEEDKIIDIKMDNNVIIFPEPYSMVTAGTDNEVLWIDLGYKGLLRFYINNDNFYPMLSNGMLVKDISGSGTNTTIDNLFTGRGYIWRNSLGILRNTMIFGHGAGTFEMYFKQFDYVGLLNSQGNVDLIIDKPHNWYLQMACNQGVLCACAVAVLIIYILINIYIAGIKNKKDTFALPAIIAIFVFCMMELLTDSYITVNPEMWLLLGTVGGMYKLQKTKGMNKNE